MSTTPAVAPAPPVALGLPIFLTAEPDILKVEDPVGRPLAIAVQHAVRDALEEAGFQLVATPEAANNVVATLVIQHVGAIHADLFIHGAEACGVRLDIMREDALLGSAEPDVNCISTSSYYGLLAKDSAVALVNTVSHAPTLLAVAETLNRQRPPTDAHVTPPPVSASAGGDAAVPSTTTK